MTASHHSIAGPDSRITFGKYKGTPLKDALCSPSILAWIKRLSSSPISKSAAIGTYYLASIERLACESGIERNIASELQDLRAQIADACELMAELDILYTREHQAIDRLQAKLFSLLRPTYEKLDTLNITYEYRRFFLKAILQGNNDHARIIAEEEQSAQSKNHQEYEEADQLASDNPSSTEQERAAIEAMYRKLATLYNPDKCSSDPESQDSCNELMKQINQIKDLEHIPILRDIAVYSTKFLESTGCQSLDLGDGSESESLQLLFTKLQERIAGYRNQLDNLRSSSDYELWKLCEQDPDLLITIAEEQIRDLDEEARKLEDECSALAGEINRNLEPDSPLRI